MVAARAWASAPHFHIFYLAFRFARRFGGTLPFSGISLSILSLTLCNGRSLAEEIWRPEADAVKPWPVYMASLNVAPEFACATAKTPCGTPLVNAVAM